jgi:hypothetical protein
VFTNRNNSFFVGRRKAASFAPLAAAPESNKKITWGFALVGCVPIALIYLVDFLGGYFPTLKEVFFILYVPFPGSDDVNHQGLTQKRFQKPPRMK